MSRVPGRDRWETRVCTQKKRASRCEKRKTVGKGEEKLSRSLSLSLFFSWTEKKREGKKDAGIRRFEGNRRRGLGLSWKVGTARYNTRLPLPAAISVNCSVPDKKNVGKIKFSSVIHLEATDAGRAGSVPIGWLRPNAVTWPRSRTRPLSRRQRPYL